MLLSVKTVALHVALCPLKRRLGEVNGCGVERATICCVAGSGTRIGKQVKEALSRAGALHELTNLGACVAVIQEDSAVQSGGKVDLKEQATFVNEQHFFSGVVSSAALVRVLRAALCTRSCS